MKTINRILLFGDSWIEGEGVYEKINLESGDNPLEEPELPFGDGPGTIREWRRQNGWNKFFRDKYGLKEHQILNNGVQGASNYESFRYLNEALKDISPSDLVLFGFSSKYRDNDCISPAYRYAGLLGEDNPVESNDMISYEKAQLTNNNKEDGIWPSMLHQKDKISKGVLEFVDEFNEDYLSTVFDERVYENMAQMNYMFYQKYCKKNQINIIFFDLFESYVDKNFVRPYYEVDESMYITYGKKHYFNQLLDYERENYTGRETHSIWERGGCFPCGVERGKYDIDFGSTVSHPNQHGYKVIFDDISKNHIDNKYKITNRIK